MPSRTNTELKRILFAEWTLRKSIFVAINIYININDVFTVIIAVIFAVIVLIIITIISTIIFIIITIIITIIIITVIIIIMIIVFSNHCYHYCYFSIYLCYHWNNNYYSCHHTDMISYQISTLIFVCVSVDLHLLYPLHRTLLKKRSFWGHHNRNKATQLSQLHCIIALVTPF